MWRKDSFDGDVPDVREQMFHLRFVKSFLRFAVHRPQFDLSLRFPRRCRAAGQTAHRHKSQNVDCSDRYDRSNVPVGV